MATVKHAMTGNSPITDTTPETTGAATHKGLPFERYFTDGKISPFDAVEWEKRTALIGNEKGVTIFRQEDVEVPKSWSQTATNIVTSKYFHGKPGSPHRAFALRRAGLAVEIFAGDDVGGRLRPALRHLDIFLAENGHALFVADQRGALLPF